MGRWSSSPAPGTGKTRVIVERVRWLLETQGGPPARADPRPDLQRQGGRGAAASASSRPSAPATAARLTVTNFHSFCQRILTESRRRRRAAAATRTSSTASARSCSSRDLRPSLGARLPRATGALRRLRQVHQPGEGRAGHARTTSTPSSPRSARSSRTRYGSYEPARDGSRRRATCAPLRDVRGAYARLRAQRARRGRGEELDYDADAAEKAADREARRTIAGDGKAQHRNQFTADAARRRSTPLADTYVADGAALEVLRLTELASSTAPTRTSSRAAARSTSASRSPPSRSCSSAGPTSCAATSASSATSWSTSSRTRTSPRSS